MQTGWCTSVCPMHPIHSPTLSQLKPKVLGVCVQEWRFIISLNELVSGLLSGSLPEGNAGVSYQVVLQH